MPTPVRLNKFLAHAGVCSRREADRLIEGGHVRVNGRVVRELGTRIDPEADRVEASGRPVRSAPEKPVFVLLNKPPGFITSVKDPLGRPTVMDLLPRLQARVYPVGRLDRDSEGALLLTNDGEIALRLTHPRYGAVKIYEARLESEPADEELDRLRRGLFLEGRRTAPVRVRVLRRGRPALVEIELREGRKREVRKMFEALGHRVAGLKRVSFAGLTLGGLKSGRWRFLKDREVAELRRLAGAPGPRPSLGQGPEPLSSVPRAPSRRARPRR